MITSIVIDLPARSKTMKFFIKLSLFLMHENPSLVVNFQIQCLFNLCCSLHRFKFKEMLLDSIFFGQHVTEHEIMRASVEMDYFLNVN